MRKDIKKSAKRYFKQQLTAGNIVAFIIFALFAFSMIYSLAWAFMASLKEHIEYTIGKDVFFPKNWLFGNYLEAFKLLNVRGNNVLSMFFNSIWLMFGQSLISMTVCCTTAYIMSKYDFVGKKVINVIIIASMMIPLYGSMSSTMRFYMNTGMYNSPLILLASASGVGSMFLILRSYFNGVSWQYAEAAKIDGANDFIVYVRIMLPIAMPAIGSIMLVMLINAWNDYTTAIYYLPDFPTIAAGLYLYKEIAGFNVNMPVYFAGVLMAAVPTFILFIVFQKQIMSSITTGGLKG